jgi:hypothetical protein
MLTNARFLGLFTMQGNTDFKDKVKTFKEYLGGSLDNHGSIDNKGCV